ncbi:N-carbamoylputrescine amidase [Spinactinospora alkalitolerans]|uniref:N-carbamoylputrescine amidase n=1 Tax=Spinactinospora alkalitolerans TaxID=687207 RepID=A0A852U5L6_9ACTN|nr:nitrilase-related carbon-nitrogen hydrolase [Spinactinospora alkalitolerans]NYE50875.1 N-carbamoylputrescine amidase [Spinactinospora alkalitolerans]
MQSILGRSLPSPARTRSAARLPLTVGLVQIRWRDTPAEHREVLRDGVLTARDAGAQVVFLPELTLSRYPADARPDGTPMERAEALPGGPTHELAADLAAEAGIPVHASLYERADMGDGLGYNTAILVAPGGELLGATRKLHIPRTAGYHEDHYFRPGPAEPNPYPVIDLAADRPEPVRLGLPTCWDEWFPEVARAYALAGADVLAYPTAIGSEPNHPDFDTEPLWRQVIAANGIANGLFMVVPNRWGEEGLVTFYGSSFVSDPYGRILVQAPREGDAALVATLDLEQRRDWLELFPFLDTRRPDTYSSLTAASGRLTGSARRPCAPSSTR